MRWRRTRSAARRGRRAPRGSGACRTSAPAAASKSCVGACATGVEGGYRDRFVAPLLAMTGGSVIARRERLSPRLASVRALFASRDRRAADVVLQQLAADRAVPQRVAARGPHAHLAGERGVGREQRQPPAVEARL